MPNSDESFLREYLEGGDAGAGGADDLQHGHLLVGVGPLLASGVDADGRNGLAGLGALLAGPCQ